MADTNPLTPQAADILRHAVSCARNEHIKTVAQLRLRLQRDYPDRDEDIDSALRFWANHAHASKVRAAQAA